MNPEEIKEFEKANQGRIKIDIDGKKYVDVAYKYIPGQGYVLAEPNDEEIRRAKEVSFLLNRYRKKRKKT